jgi:hypothetical protein
METLLTELTLMKSIGWREVHRQWVDSAVQTGDRGRESKCTQSIAVGSKTFTEKLKESLALKQKV